MLINRLLILSALPLMIGVSSFIVPYKTIASQSQLIAQNPSPPQENGRTQRPHPNFAAAAQKLGVTEAQLKTALGVPDKRPTDRAGRPPRPDFKAAAAKLGVTEAQLIEALGVPSHPPGGDRSHQRPHHPNFAAAAQKLGVTEAQLKAALGVPDKPPTDRAGRPPRPDFKAAAAKLGVTEAQLIEALGVPPHPPEGDRPPTEK